VKGKYEHELQFAFALKDMPLVPEDEIFSNNQSYAEVRCRLRKDIDLRARRFGLPGLEPIA